MIRQECEGIAGGHCLRKDRCTTMKKIIPVTVVEKYSSSFDAANNDVMKNACRIEPGLSGHGCPVSWERKSVKDWLFSYGRPHALTHFPCIARPLRFQKQLPKALEESFSVEVVPDYGPPLYSTKDDVMQSTGLIYSPLSRHNSALSRRQ